MPVVLTSPYTFRERILLYGQGGSGKTKSVLDVARVIADGEMFVVDNDYSSAYERAIETEYQDAADKVHVHECDADWESITNGIAAAIEQGTNGNERDNWLVIDSISSTWQAVQDYMTEQVTGASAADHLAKLRKEAANLKEFHSTVSDSVPWQIINKEYASKVWVPLRSWPGHFIITAEAKTFGAKEPELVSWFQHLGQMPEGQKKLPYVSATTLLLKRGTRGEFQFTVVKDRNRNNDLENEPLENFAMDYLRDVAGWEMKVVKK